MRFYSLLIVLAIALATALSSRAAMADYPRTGVHLYCDASADRAIVSYFELPSAGSAPRFVDWGQRADCVLRDGTMIRLKASSDQAFAYGYCGATPPHWFSLWVNQTKILSRHPSWVCRGVTLDQVTISAAGISVCDFQSRSTDPAEPELPDHYGDTPTEWPTECGTLPLPEAGMLDDLTEYPPEGSTPQPEPGTYLLTRSRDAALCFGALTTDQDGARPRRPNELQRPDWQRIESPGFGVPAFRATFDFDNDGTVDRVLRLETFDHASDGSYFVVAPLSAPVPENWNDIEDRRSRRDPRLGTFYSGNESDYGMEHVHWEPFFAAGRTYLLGQPVREPVEPALEVVQARTGRLVDVCSFELVRENY
jgi:hypothetical protein